QGYAKQVIQQAQGRASRFNQLVKAYHKAPNVTRTRMYLDTMQDVLSNSSKVLLDVEESNPLLYLPLNKLLRKGQSPSGQKGASTSSSSTSSGNSSGQASSSGSSRTSTSSGSGTVGTLPMRARQERLR